MSNCQDNIHIASLTIFEISKLISEIIIKISLYFEMIQKDIKIHIEPDKTGFTPLMPIDNICVGSLCSRSMRVSMLDLLLNY